MTARPTALHGLASALEAQSDRLLPCVHCGFCLPACPTYNRLGDEADSPRGRLHLMGAVVEGRLDPASDAFRTHIDRCLGCRACEPVCPSGVEYGTLLELARDTAAESRPPGLLTRMLLAVMGSAPLRGMAFGPARLLRATGLAALGVRVLPAGRVFRIPRFGLAMLAGSRRWRPGVARARAGAGHAEVDDHTRTAATDHERTGIAADDRTRVAAADQTGIAAADRTVVVDRGRSAIAEPRVRVALLTGCVQQGLYGHVNEATVRVLEANGYEVVSVPDQDCCGALHAHGGSLAGARLLARRNMAAFDQAGVDHVVVNTAGCGAAMKEYDTLLAQDPEHAHAAVSFSERVRDVTELLAAVGPRRGAPVPCRVAYDHPCHLLHGQGVRQAPLDVLAAIPGVDVAIIENADECCGGAGIYGITHPDLGGRIGGDKVDAVERAGAVAACTPNPGCMMQIGAGLRLRGRSEGVVHPVELLDESYRRAGYYGVAGTEEPR